MDCMGLSEGQSAYWQGLEVTNPAEDASLWLRSFLVLCEAPKESSRLVDALKLCAKDQEDDETDD